MELIIGFLSFPDNLTLIQIVSLVLVSFATCFFSGIIGIGGGLILLAFYATVLPITAVIPVHGFLQFWNNLWRAILTKDFHAPVLKSFIFGFFVGIAFFHGNSCLTRDNPSNIDDQSYPLSSRVFFLLALYCGNTCLLQYLLLSQAITKSPYSSPHLVLKLRKVLSIIWRTKSMLISESLEPLSSAMRLLILIWL